MIAHEVGNIIFILSLQARKPRLRSIKQQTQGEPAMELRNQDWTATGLAPEPEDVLARRTAALPECMCLFHSTVGFQGSSPRCLHSLSASGLVRSFTHSNGQRVAKEIN